MERAEESKRVESQFGQVEEAKAGRIDEADVIADAERYEDAEKTQTEEEDLSDDGCDE